MSQINDMFTIYIERRKMIIFLTGFITMFHLVTLFSYAVYGIVIVLLLLLSLMENSDILQGKLDIRAADYLLWYGLFVALIAFSAMYTVNTINPDYVYKRVFVIFALGFIVSLLVTTEDDFKTLANGLMAGAFTVAIVSLVNESGLAGIGRIGNSTVGSAVALSQIMLVGIICSLWRCIYIENNRRLYIILSVFFEVIIFLTGSRRPLILSFAFLLLFFLFNHNIRQNRKIFGTLAIVAVITLMLYFALTNEFLYNLVGWRLESMLNVFSSDSSTIEDASMLERSIMQQYAITLFSNRPLFGYGAHGFAYMFNQAYGKLLYSHCGFTEILSCYGIIGFAIFYRGFWKFIKNIKLILNYETSWQILLVLYAIMVLVTEGYSIAFLTPQVIVMLVAGRNMLRQVNTENESYTVDL